MLFPLTMIGLLFFVVSFTTIMRCGAASTVEGLDKPACTQTWDKATARKRVKAVRSFLRLGVSTDYLLILLTKCPDVVRLSCCGKCTWVDDPRQSFLRVI